MSKMTSREHVEALERVLNDDKSPDLPRRPRPGSEPFAGMDHTGMPQGAELARVERAALLSFLPGHRPWEDVSAYDAQLAEITQGAACAMEAVRTLTEQLASEPQRHADALAEWMLHKDGERPESRAVQLERDLAEAEAERNALLLAESKVLEDRARHVERHRDRLVKVADGLAEEKSRRMLELIDELEQERVGLTQAREAALWARLFPADATRMLMPRWETFAGALVRLLSPLGFTAQVDATRVFEALRGDVEWLRDAVGPEQRAALEGEREPDVRREAVWSSNASENAAKREALEAARQAFIAEWGWQPSEMQLEAFIRERKLSW